MCIVIDIVSKIVLIIIIHIVIVNESNKVDDTTTPRALM